MTVVPIRSVPRLTDAELLGTEFRIEDPEDIPGLNLGVPDRGARPTIVGYYDLTPPGGRRAHPVVPLVRCCHCWKRLHWKGRVVRDDRGEIYIIGARGCGREHYGDRYVDAEKTFKQEQMRRAALGRWRAMLPLIDGYLQECEALRGSSGLAALELKAAEIKRASPTGHAKLVRHVGTGQQLVAHWEERDIEQEAERDSKYERAMATYRYLPRSVQMEWKEQGLVPEREIGPIYKQMSEDLGHVVGAEFLTDGGDVRQRLIALRETLSAISEIDHKGTDRTPLKVLNQRLREMTDHPRELQAALHALSFATLFFAADNLDRIERWSRLEHRFGYVRRPDGLVVDDAARGRTVISPLGAVALPECPMLRDTRYLNEDFHPAVMQAA